MSRFALGALLLAALTLAAPMPAAAQMCAGSPSFRTGRGQLNISGAFTGQSQSVGAGLAGGRILFGGAGFAITNFSDVDGLAKTLLGAVGADLGVGSGQRVFVCPLAQLAVGFGPQLGPVDVRSFLVAAGGSVGILAVEADALSVVPTFNVQATHQRVTLKLAGFDETESDNYGSVGVGVGFIVNRRIGITPGVSVPFGLSDSEVTFTLTFALHFGG